MEQSDFTKFETELRRTADAFNAELTPARIATYFHDLQDLPLTAVIAGLQSARRTLTFFPKIAEIRQSSEGSVSDRSELAWRTFVELVQFQGGYPSLQVYDGAMAYAIECMGGWTVGCQKLNDASPEMVAHHSKAFKSSYQIGSKRDEQARYFVGQHEAANRSLGAWKEPTIEQRVIAVIPGRTQEYVMRFDLATGRLTEECRQALRLGRETLARYLPAPAATPIAALSPAPDEEMATPEEVQEILDAITRLAGKNVLRFPAITAAGIEAEAALIGAEDAGGSGQPEQEDYALQGA